MRLVKNLWNDDRGISPIIEWALGVAIVALIASPVITDIANTTKTKLEAVNSAIQNAGTTGSGG